MITLSTNNFSKTISSDKPTLVDFSAAWCGPCRMLSPILESLSKEIDNVSITKIDVDESPELANAYGVNSVPTIMIFQNGKPIFRHVGLASKESLKKLLSNWSK